MPRLTIALALAHVATVNAAFDPKNTGGVHLLEFGSEYGPDDKTPTHAVCSGMFTTAQATKVRAVLRGMLTEGVDYTIDSDKQAHDALTRRGLVGKASPLEERTR